MKLLFIVPLFVFMNAEKCNDKNIAEQTSSTNTTSKEEKQKPSGLPGTLSFKMGASITLNTDPVTKITFSDVTDSRCPKGCQCIWEGNANMTFKLQSGKKDTTITIGTTDWPIGDMKHSTRAEALGLYFKMVSLLPYPVCHEEVPAKSTYTSKIYISKEPIGDEPFDLK